MAAGPHNPVSAQLPVGRWKRWKMMPDVAPTANRLMWRPPQRMSIHGGRLAAYRTQLGRGRYRVEVCE